MRIGDLLQQRHVKAVEQDYLALRTEVQKLVSEFNFELAMQRLQAFPGKDEATVTSKLQTLNDEVTRAKSSYLNNLRLKVQSASNQKNLTKLKELRDQLPAPLLGTDAETDIANAIKVLDDEQQADQQTIVNKAAVELAHWNFAGLEVLNNNSRATMGTTEKGKQFDAYYQAAQQLTAMTKAMGVQLKAATRHPRYRGVLKGWPDPDLMSADMNGLQIEIASGGTASIKWTELPNDALATIVKLVLLKDAETYLPAIDVLTAAQMVEVPK
jgi:hypothetical protein